MKEQDEMSQQAADVAFSDAIRLMADAAVAGFLATPVRWVVRRKRDKKLFSTPADRRVAEGLVEYLESTTNDRFVVEEAK